MVQLAGLTGLQRLFLDGTEITDAGLKHLEGLKRLERLGVDSTMVTDAGLERLEGPPTDAHHLVYLRESPTASSRLGVHLDGMAVMWPFDAAGEPTEEQVVIEAMTLHELPWFGIGSSWRSGRPGDNAPEFQLVNAESPVR